MTKIVLTGVDGNFGGIAAEKILERGVAPGDLIFTTPFPEKVAHYAARGIEVRRADYTNPETLTQAFAGGENLLFISMPVVGEKRVAMHRNAVAAAKAAGIKMVVYTSIVGAGDPKNDALVTVDHNATEAMIKDAGLDYIFVRDSQYAEAIVQYVLPGAFKSGKWTTNQGSGTIGYVSRRDCAEAAVALVCGAGEKNRTYTINGPELLTLRDIAKIAEAVTGKKIEVVDLTDEATYAMFDAIGVPRTTENGMKGSPIPWCSDDMVSFGRAVRVGHMKAFTDDFRKLTGHAPLSMRQLIEDANNNHLYA